MDANEVLEPKRNPVVAFADSPWFGIGVGVLVAAFGPVSSAKWLIGFGWLIITIQMFRNFFLTRGRISFLAFNSSASLVLALVLIIVWHFAPKSPEPLTPRDVQEAVRNELSKTPQYKSAVAPPSIKENGYLTTKAELAAAIRAGIEQFYKSTETAHLQPESPPISNSDLRKEVAEYTAHLRGIEGQRDQDWRELFPITKGGMIAPEYDHAEHQQKWEKSEKTIEDDFIKNDLGNGIRLRDELLKRLKQAGPPTPMNALLGAFPTPERGVPETELPFTQLADYLDALSNRLPNP
jgi:hypothetical protein